MCGQTAVRGIYFSFLFFLWLMEMKSAVVNSGLYKFSKNFHEYFTFGKAESGQPVVIIYKYKQE